MKYYYGPVDTTAVRENLSKLDHLSLESDEEPMRPAYGRRRSKNSNNASWSSKSQGAPVSQKRTLSAFVVVPAEHIAASDGGATSSYRGRLVRVVEGVDALVPEKVHG